LKKPDRNKIFIVIIVTLFMLSLIVYSSVPGSPLNAISSPISFITDPVYFALSKTTGSIGGFFSSITKSEAIRKKNIVLEGENARLKQKVKELEENGRRWTELKSALKIKDLFSDYEIIGARVLTREIGDWFDVFRVNVGIKGNIIIDNITSYAVVDSKMNLVGRVLASDYTSSKILPILSEGSVVSAKVNSAGGGFLRVRGDVTQKQKGYCIVDNISDYSSLKIGDEVITSGVGGLYPPGIPIGVVKELLNQNQKVEKKAVLEVYSQYKTLTDVFIMKGSPPG
jgi:rod shape-determining protein MreC